MQNFTELPLNILRQMWTEAWKKQPGECEQIGRVMLEKSLAFRLETKFTQDQQDRLEQLVKTYRRNPKYFDERCSALKPGTQLIRSWNGKKHTILVKGDGFDYQGRLYTSLSQIANDITGTRWNGPLFFGLKKKGNT
jgi:hypothetical protein